MRTIPFSVLALLALLPAPVVALDHDNLDPNRPIGMENAYAIPKGEIGLEPVRVILRNETKDLPADARPQARKNRKRIR